MSFDQALQAAQQGNFSFIQSIGLDDLSKLLRARDEDGRQGPLVSCLQAAQQDSSMAAVCNTAAITCYTVSPASMHSAFLAACQRTRCLVSGFDSVY